MKQKKFWLKLIGVVILLHITLILLSIIEVTIYSYLIDPGHDKKYYNAHAIQSAPWISIVFGSFFVFLLVKRFVNRFDQQHLLYTIALPLIYTISDFMIVFPDLENLNEVFFQLIGGKGSKFAASFTAYYIYSYSNKEK